MKPRKRKYYDGKQDGLVDIPYTLKNINDAAVQYPNGGIFVGDPSVAREDREYIAPTLNLVTISAPRTNRYNISYDLMRQELDNRLKEFEQQQLSSNFESYAQQHPREAYVMRKIGAVPEYERFNTYWRMPTREYSDKFEEAGSRWDEVNNGADPSIVSQLELGNRRNANEKADLADALKFRNWYYFQCALAANEINRRMHLPTTGNAWTRRGIYGDSLIFNNPNLEYVYSQDQKLLPSKRLFQRRSLLDGDFVDLIYDLTSHGAEARTGRGNSHTGTVVTDDTGYPWIVDNMGGKLKMRRLEDVMEGKKGNLHVQAIRRPGSYMHAYDNATARLYDPAIDGPVRYGSWAEQYVGPENVQTETAQERRGRRTKAKLRAQGRGNKVYLNTQP